MISLMPRPWQALFHFASVTQGAGGLTRRWCRLERLSRLACLPWLLAEFCALASPGALRRERPPWLRAPAGLRQAGQTGQAAEKPAASLRPTLRPAHCRPLPQSGTGPAAASRQGKTRRQIQPGAVSVDGEVVKDIQQSYKAEEFDGEGKLVKRGKKKFVKVVR